MRLNRYLALAGLGARRKCEELILQGRVEVNRETVLSLSVQVDPDKDVIRCDGQKVRLPRTFFYAKMNKPAGVLVTADDERGRATVYDLLPERLRSKVRSVGRLDQGSEGLLLLTNDGILANALLHPRNEVPRTYMAWVTPPPDLGAIRALRAGVQIGAREKSGAAEVRLMHSRAGTARVRLTLREGKNREVRRMFLSVGCRVLALRRISFDGVMLDDLRPGQVRPLTLEEVASLRRASGVGEDR